MMARCLVVALLAFATLSPVLAVEQTLLDHYARQGLDKLKGLMKSGLDLGFFAIPSLDPFSRAQEKFDINEAAVKLSGEVDDVLVEGLAGFTVDLLSINLAKAEVKVKLSFPTISASAKYDANGQVSAKILGEDVPIPVNGKGSGTASASGLSVEVDIGLTTTDKGQIQISQLALQWGMTDVKVNVPGLYEDKELGKVINRLLADALPHVIQKYSDKITALLLEKLKAPVNKLLLQLHIDSKKAQVRTIKKDAVPKVTLQKQEAVVPAEPEERVMEVDLGMHEPLVAEVPRQELLDLLQKLVDSQQLSAEEHAEILAKMETGYESLMESRLVGSAKIFL